MISPADTDECGHLPDECGQNTTNPSKCPLSLESLSAFVRIRVRFTSGSVAKWRKMKGVCEIRLRSGLVVNAELHWYEAHGIGRKEFKVKRLLE